MRSRFGVLVGAAIAASAFALASAVPTASGATSTSRVAASTGSHVRGIDCSNSRFICPEIHDSDEAFGHYVGHDEPSLLFRSTVPGSGNRMRYSGILPKEPAPSNIPGARSYDFELYPTIWYGMALCDTQSFPNTVHTCRPDSDANITKPGDPFHPGTAFMEVQFYPPGFVQQFDGFSCSARRWCVALTIDSYSNNPFTGQSLNAACTSKVGIEYVNFAYLTKSGRPQGPPNPVDFDPIASGKPNPNKVAFLNQGDHYTLTMHDTAHGVETIVHDTTTGVTGKMTASAANGFGQVEFAPTGKSCTNIPYDFHPEYSTSTPKTTVPWAAATYNIAIDTEVGHFDYCTTIDPNTGSCVGKEGAGRNQEPADGDDNACFPGADSTLVRINGCLDSNLGYDGPSYLRDWPNGSKSRPSPTILTSPKTGSHYDVQYANVGFNTDLPAIEQALTPACNGDTGKNCTIPPVTDDGTPAAFYPYYSSGRALGGCAWTVGQKVRGFSINDYGKLKQYGSLLKVTYPDLNGTTDTSYEDFQQYLGHNPCKAR
jgi:hypothetical protein